MKAKIICGIYYIKNKINNKIYVGLSINIGDRIRKHMKDLSEGFHSNIELQRAWRKYGKNNFEFGVLEECLKDELENKEICWIAKYDSYKSGYNRTIGGYGNSGVSEESIIKKALTKEGKKLPEAMILRELRQLLKNLHCHCIATYGLTFDEFKMKENKTKKQIKDLDRFTKWVNELEEMRN